MANRDPEPESAHEQFSEDYLAKQKAKAEVEAAPPPAAEKESYETTWGPKSGKK